MTHNRRHADTRMPSVPSGVFLLRHTSRRGVPPRRDRYFFPSGCPERAPKSQIACSPACHSSLGNSPCSKAAQESIETVSRHDRLRLR